MDEHASLTDSSERLAEALRNPETTLTPEDRAYFIDIIEQAKSERKEFDRKINELLQKRSALDKSVDLYKAALSPLRSVSRDVLEEIFLRCLPTGRNPSMNAREAPMLLGRVCSSWRKIAFSTPKLWSAIAIVVPYYKYDKEKVCSKEEYIGAWLSRSGSLPLHISFAEGNAQFHPVGLGSGGSVTFENGIPTFSIAPEAPNPFAESTLNAVLPFSERWKHLDVGSPVLIRYTSVLDTPGSRVPTLDSLTFPCGIFEPDTKERTLELLRAPALRSIAFSIVPDMTSENLSLCLSLPVAWEQLTSLSIASNFSGTFFTDDALQAIRRCQSLKTFDVTLCGLQQEAGQGQPQDQDQDIALQVSSPSLESLSVNNTGGDLSCFFRSLRHVPNLRHITYNEPVMEIHIENVPDVAFPLTSFCPIVNGVTHLRVSVLPTKCPDVIDFIRSTPQLKILTMALIVDHRTPPPMSFTVEMLEALTVADDPAIGKEALCPLLENFVIFPTVLVPVSTFEKFFLSRDGHINGVTLVKRARIGFMFPLPKEYKADLTKTLRSSCPNTVFDFGFPEKQNLVPGYGHSLLTQEFNAQGDLSQMPFQLGQLIQVAM